MNPAGAPPIRRCLGTRLCADPLPPRPVTWLLSDLHLDRQLEPGSGEEALLGRLARVLDVARHNPEGHRVFILGDLFEFYVDARQLSRPDLPGWAAVRELLRAATDAGVPVAALWGNRDFLLDPGFAGATGCPVVRGGVWLTLAGQPTLLLHGDELCLNDRPYQRSKRFMRNRLVQTIFRTLPLSLRLRVGGSARKESERSTAQGDPARFHPTQGALDAVFATGARRLVFGHIHRAARGPWPATAEEPSGEYLVLPAFDADLAAGGDPLAGCCLRAVEPGAEGGGGLGYWDPIRGGPVADPGAARWAGCS